MTTRDLAAIVAALLLGRRDVTGMDKQTVDKALAVAQQIIRGADAVT